MMHLLRYALQAALLCGLVLVLVPYCTWRVLAAAPRS